MTRKICPKCRNRGYISTFENGYAVIKGYCDCECGKSFESSIWRQRLLDSRIYEEYHSLELKDLIPQETPEHVNFVQYLKQYIETINEQKRAGQSLLISGGVGTGKTLGGMLILKAALRQHSTAYYISWTEMLNLFIQDGDEEKKQQKDKLKESNFLVIDQLGADSIKKESRHPVTTLEEVLRYRFTRLKPTILISDRTYAELALRYPIVEDFKDKLDVLEVRGKNWRKVKRLS